MYTNEDILKIIDEEPLSYKLTGGQKNNITKEIMELKKVIANGGFKADHVLSIIKRLGLWNVFDKIVKLYVHNSLTNTLRNLQRNNMKLYIIYEEAIESLRKFSKESPNNFEKLKHISENTSNYNENTFRVLLFIVLKCPEVINIFFKQILNIETFISLFLSELPLPTRVMVNTFISTTAKVILPILRPDLMKKGYAPTKELLYKIINSKLKPYTNASGSILNVLKAFNITSTDFESIVQLSSGTLSSMINKVDPYGVILPFSSYICFDIIHKRIQRQSLTTFQCFLVITLTVLIITFIIHSLSYSNEGFQSTKELGDYSLNFLKWNL